MSTQQERDQDPLIGHKVRTIHPSVHDWTYENHLARQWGVIGVVKDLSNAHGLCYKVEHDDGSSAWYDPKELEDLKILTWIGKIL